MKRFAATALLVVLLIGGGQPAAGQTCRYEAAAQLWISPGPVLHALYRDTALAPITAVDWNEWIAVTAKGLLAPAALDSLLEKMDRPAGEPPEDRQRLRDDLSRHSAILRDADHPHLYHITVRHPDRDLALNLVKFLVQDLIESVHLRLRDVEERGHKVLQNQIAVYESRLRALEQRIQNVGGGRGQGEPAASTDDAADLPDPPGRAVLLAALNKAYGLLHRRYQALLDKRLAIEASRHSNLQPALWLDVTARPAVSAVCREESPL